MKKLVSFLLALLMVLPLTAGAAVATFAEGTKDGIDEALGEVLNAEGSYIDFWSQGDYDWVPTTKGQRECAVTTTQGQSNTSCEVSALVPIEEGQLLCFDFCLSAESTDKLRLYIDGHLDLAQGGEWGWRWSRYYYEATETTNSMEVQWVFEKDGSTDDGEDTCWLDNVQVVDPTEVADVYFNTEFACLNVGESISIEPLVFPETANGGSVTWESSNPSVASVNSSGEITGKSNGEALIYATIDSVKSYGIEISVGTYPLVEDFEDDLSSNWSVYDGNGDGKTWSYVTPAQYFHPYEGNRCIGSASYDDATGESIAPDNWLISPFFAATSDCDLSFYVQSQEDSEPYTDEHYSIYVGTGDCAEISDFTEVYSAITAVTLWEHITIALDDYAGQYIKIAIRHHDSADNYWIKFDYIVVQDNRNGADPTPDGPVPTDAPSTPTPTPVPTPPVGDTLYSTSFETTGEYAAWTQIDADGDTHVWEHFSNEMVSGGTNAAYDGEYFLATFSFINNEGALTPDNYIYSPVISIPDDGKGYALSYYVGALDPDWPMEKYSVVVGDANASSAADFTTLTTETLSSAAYSLRTVDLSAYAGQQIRIGFRHFGTTDVYCLLLDMVTVYATGTGTPTPTPTSAPTPTPTNEPTPTPAGETFTVTFVDWDDTVISEVEVAEGEDAVAPADPEREGYMFAGWDGELTNVTEDRTIKATYEQYGDANGDGLVNTGDAVTVLKYAVDMYELDETHFALADFNKDGKVNTGDAVSILVYCVEA